MDVSLPKNNLTFKKKFFLRLYFRDKGHLYAKCLFNILTICPKCHRFHFFSRGIRMYFPILIFVENGRFTSRKNGDILLKNVDFES